MANNNLQSAAVMLDDGTTLSLVNIETGEVLDIDCPDEKLSEALKIARMAGKRANEAEHELLKAVKMRLHDGDTKFANYWDIQFQEPRISESEDCKLLSKESRSEFNKMKKMFDTYKKNLFKSILEKKPKMIVVKLPKY